MKDAPEAEESLEVDVDDSDNIFDTPSLLWLQRKKSFLKKARDYQFWGRQGSKQRVIAMDSFRKYCVQSMDLTAVSPSLSMDALFDMQNIIHEQRLLPMPNYVRRKLVDVSKKDEHDPDLQVSGVMGELDDLCDDALAQYEKSEWSKLQRSRFNHGEAFVSEVISSIKAKKTCESSCQVSLAHDDDLLTSRDQSVGQFFDDAKERKSLEILEAVMKQELLVDNLPSVPQDEVFDPIDLEIETKLLKRFLKHHHS